MQYRTHILALPPICVCLFSYGFDWRKARSYTAPFVRLFTGKRFNHGALLINGYLIEAAEDGVVIAPIESTIDRKKARIEIRAYTGTKTLAQLEKALIEELGKQYDFVALLQQLVYRLTSGLAFCINNFTGRTHMKGCWIGSKSKRRHGCFELIFTMLGYENAHLASGWEFDTLKDFDHYNPVFTELK